VGVEFSLLTTAIRVCAQQRQLVAHDQRVCNGIIQNMVYRGCLWTDSGCHMQHSRYSVCG
jgi:hypothetical protein